MRNALVLTMSAKESVLKNGPFDTIFLRREGDPAPYAKVQLPEECVVSDAIVSHFKSETDGFVQLKPATGITEEFRIYELHLKESMLYKITDWRSVERTPVARVEMLDRPSVRPERKSGSGVVGSVNGEMSGKTNITL